MANEINKNKRPVGEDDYCIQPHHFELFLQLIHKEDKKTGY